MTSATQPLTRARPPDADARGAGPATRGRAGSRWLFTAPFFVLFVLFLFWPVLSALRTSLFDDSLVGGSLAGRG